MTKRTGGFTSKKCGKYVGKCGNHVQRLIFEQAKIDAKKNIVILPANICKDSGYNLKLELSGSSENADSGRDCHQRSGCRLGRFLTCLVSGLGEPPTKTNSIKLPIPSFPGTQPWICSKGAKRNPEIFLITRDHIPCTWWVSH